MAGKHRFRARLKQILHLLPALPVYVVAIPLLGVFFVFVRCLDWLYRFLPHGRDAFFPTRIFPWVPDLEENWFKIRKEMDALLTDLDQVPNYQDLAPSLVTDDDKWKAVVLSVAGHRIDEYATLCPETTALIERIPGLQYAMFSVLRPDKHIPAHRSLYSGVLNCHLALRIPQPRESCALRVAGETRHYEEGRMLIFNDLNLHEAWNRSEEVRVVLLMYVVRPLPFPISAVNRCVIWFAQRLRGATVAQIRRVASASARRMSLPQAT